MKRKTKIFISVSLIFITGVITGICTGVYIAHERIATFKDMGNAQRKKFMLQHISHKLDLSNEQKLKIKPLIEELQSLSPIKKDSTKQLYKSLKNIIEADSFDEKNYRKTYREIALIREDYAIRQALVKRKIYSLLTESQKENFGPFLMGFRGQNGKQNTKRMKWHGGK